MMETRQEITAAWEQLLDDAEPQVEKSNHLAAVKKILDGYVSKKSDTWPVPVKALRQAPPSSPSAGDRYAVGGSPAGAWSGHGNSVAEYDGASWGFAVPPNGALLMCTDTEMILQRRNSEWLARYLVSTQRYRNTGPVSVDATSPTEVWSLAGAVQAGRRYRVSVELVLSCDSADNGIAIGLNGPACTAVVVDGTLPQAAAPDATGHVAAYGTAVTATSLPYADTPFRARIDAVVISPAEDGSMVLTAAVNQAGDTMQVLAGSTMEITDITD